MVAFGYVALKAAMTGAGTFFAAIFVSCERPNRLHDSTAIATAAHHPGPLMIFMINSSSLVSLNRQKRKPHFCGASIYLQESIAKCSSFYLVSPCDDAADANGASDADAGGPVSLALLGSW